MKKELNILIIDDDPISLVALKTLLCEHCFCEIEEVFSATEAFDHIQSKVKDLGKFFYDWIFVDIHLPDIEGYSLVNILSKLGLAKKSRVVAITADCKFDQRLCLENGISDTIIKPVTLEHLEKVGLMSKR